MNTIDRDGQEPKLLPNSPTLPSPVIAPIMEDANEAGNAGPATGNAIVASSAEANTNDVTVSTAKVKTTKRRRKRSVAKNRVSKKDRRALYLAREAERQLKQASQPVSSGNISPGGGKSLSMPDPPGKKSDEQPVSAEFSDRKKATSRTIVVPCG